MMSNRSYRPAMTATVCHHEIEKNSGVMYDPQVVAAAMNCWDELVSRYTEVETPPTPYFDRLQLEHTRQAHDYLLANQGSHITLAELAARFHLSQSSLKICFKALYGVPVASYLRGLRMDTAANLLRSSDLPVAEIAHRVGYEDPSRFAAAAIPAAAPPNCAVSPAPHRPKMRAVPALDKNPNGIFSGRLRITQL